MKTAILDPRKRYFKSSPKYLTDC